MHAPDQSHLIPGQLGLGIPLAMVIVNVEPTLRAGILHVVSSGAGEQVCGTNTWWVVALVQNV
jgi:hypothetical protein